DAYWVDYLLRAWPAVQPVSPTDEPGQTQRGAVGADNVRAGGGAVGAAWPGRRPTRTRHGDQVDSRAPALVLRRLRPLTRGLERRRLPGLRDRPHGASARPRGVRDILSGSDSAPGSNLRGRVD